MKRLLALWTSAALSLASFGCGSDNKPAARTYPAAVAFVSSATGTGNLSTWAGAGGATGVAAGDNICQGLATASGLTGTFKAWLSDSTTDAYCHVLGFTGKKSAGCGQTPLNGAAGPWIETDGGPFAAVLHELVYDGVVYRPLTRDEAGNVLPATNYFTGTRGDGSVATNYTCSDWISDGTDNVTVGYTDSTFEGWTNGRGSGSCDGTYHLACLQTGSGPALPDFVATGKKVFLSSEVYNGNLGGLTGADAKCQALATAAIPPLTGTFKAWLSDSTYEAKDRLTSNGPWVRLDGVRLAEDKADLLDGALETSINLTETGQYLYDERAVTATHDDGTRYIDLSSNPPHGTCSNWSDATANTDRPITGADVDMVVTWSTYGWTGCDSTNLRLYCFED